MRRLLVLLAVVLMAVAACGSSSKKSANATLAPATGGSNGSATSAAASGASAGTPRYCADPAANTLAQKVSQIGAGNTGTAALQQELNALKQFEADAPSAIKGDVSTVVNFYEKYVQIFINDQGNTSKLASDLQGVQPQEAGLTTAIKHITDYYAANCHA